MDGMQDVELFSSETLERIFANDHVLHKGHVYNCAKNSLPVNFTIPSANGEIKTLEANQQFLGRSLENKNNFHVLVSSENTIAYPVLVTDFVIKYSITSTIPSVYDDLSGIVQDIGILCDQNVVGGKALPRSIPVKAARILAFGNVATSWGSILPFSPDSFIIRYKENDFAVCDPNVFSATYSINIEIESLEIPHNGFVCTVFFNGCANKTTIGNDIRRQLSDFFQHPANQISVMVDGIWFDEMTFPKNKSIGDVLRHSNSFLLNFNEGPVIDSPIVTVEKPIIGAEKLPAFECVEKPVVSVEKLPAFECVGMGVEGNVTKKRKIQYLKYANDADPFKKKTPLVKWAPRSLIDSPDDNDDFPQLICATQFFLGYKACSTPNVLVSINITGVVRMDCSYCNQRVKRGLSCN
jgi:hypothetical protein